MAETSTRMQAVATNVTITLTNWKGIIGADLIDSDP
jgi:hypothetical protein